MAPRFFGPLLIAGDFALTLHFYRDLLGLPVEGEHPYAECKSERSAFSIVDGEFWRRTNSTERVLLGGAHPPAVTVLAIQVEDVEAMFERLMALEVKFLSPPTPRPQMGLSNAFLRDPDGRLVELTSPLAASEGASRAAR